MSLVVFRLEEVTPQIMERLTHLEKTAFGEGGMNHWQLAPLVRYGRVFCLAYGGEIIGVMEFMRTWDQYACYLVGSPLYPQYRSLGYGKYFLKQALDQIQRDGLGRSCLRWLRITYLRLPAVCLLGFQQVGFLKDEYGPGEDRLLLELSQTRFKLLWYYMYIAGLIPSGYIRPKAVNTRLREDSMRLGQVLWLLWPAQWANLLY